MELYLIYFILNFINAEYLILEANGGTIVKAKIYNCSTIPC